MANGYISLSKLQHKPLPKAIALEKSGNTRRGVVLKEGNGPKLQRILASRRQLVDQIKGSNIATGRVLNRRYVAIAFSPR